MQMRYLLLALATAASMPAKAQNSGDGDAADPRMGSSAWPGVVAEAAPSPFAEAATIAPFRVYHQAQYGSGGTGLRNRGGSAISVSGVVAPVRAAFAYWAVISQGTAGTANQRVKLQRLLPTQGSTVTVGGTVIGTGPSPCWPGSVITVFRGPVPISTTSGNGTYKITLLFGASGSTGGQDPWVSATLPLMEGASLVLIGTGDGTVSLYDSGLAGSTFGAGGVPATLNYSLSLPVATSGSQVLFDNIGADGQTGPSRTDSSLMTSETTHINGHLVAGAAGPDHDSDWDGAVAGPLPKLWDDTGHDITFAAPKGTTTLKVLFSTGAANASHWDCLTPIANIVGEF